MSDTKKFKYRSLDAIGRKTILEQNRRQIEEMHFSTASRLEIIKSLPMPEDPNEAVGRETDIRQMESRLATWEGMIDKYNEELLSVSEEIDKAKEGD